MGKNKEDYWLQSINSQKDRLRESVGWQLYPCFISAGFLLIFSSYVLFSLNPRLGNPSDLIPLEAQESEEGSIWLSMSLQGTDLVISTSERRVFRWPHKQNSPELIESFVHYLKNKVLETEISAALEKRILKAHSLVVLAADKNLEFSHIRPVLYALAQAGISHYAFEVKKPLL